MDNKTVLITGANSGIGFEATKKLAVMGARIIMACRNLKLGQDAKDAVLALTPGATLELKKVDVSDLQSVRDFAHDILKTESRLDVLIHNAGIGGGVLFTETSRDGLNMTMATNYFGSVLLTHLLIDLLKKSAPSRIVFVSSKLYCCAPCNASNVNSYNLPYFLYCRSKKAQMMFCLELARRLKGTGVTANFLHPGVVDTGIFRLVPFPVSLLFDSMKKLMKTPEEGARTTVYAATAPELEHVSGQYLRDSKQAELRFKTWFSETENHKLFEVSKTLVKLTSEDPVI